MSKKPQLPDRFDVNLASALYEKEAEIHWRSAKNACSELMNLNRSPHGTLSPSVGSGISDIYKQIGNELVALLFNKDMEVMELAELNLGEKDRSYFVNRANAIFGQWRDSSKEILRSYVATNLDDSVVSLLTGRINHHFTELVSTYSRDLDIEIQKGKITKHKDTVSKSDRRTKLKRKLFIAHSADEDDLAIYLGNWLENSFDISSFVASRRGDLQHGRRWWKQIIDAAKERPLFLLLLSPYSLHRDWLSFEAGLGTGSDEDGASLVVPCLIGGLKSQDLPSTISGFECLNLCNHEDFNSFIKHSILTGTDPNIDQQYQSFDSLAPHIVKRILKYGEMGGIVSSKVNTEKINLNFDQNTHPTILSIVGTKGKIVGVRASIWPYQEEASPHWKFGFKFGKRDDSAYDVSRIFEFHSGSHLGNSSWTLYPGKYSGILPLNQPAQIEFNQVHKLQIWMDENFRSVKCVGIDSDGRIALMKNKNFEDIWVPNWSEIDSIRINGWADNAKFNLNVEIEVDRVDITQSD